MGAIILNGDQIYTEELIRENARLTVQHEADRQIIEALTEKLGLMDTAERAAKEAVPLKKELDQTNVKLRQAVSDLHFVMAGGDPCKVCGKVCMMGTTKCEPVWKGEKTEG